MYLPRGSCQKHLQSSAEPHFPPPELTLGLHRASLRENYSYSIQYTKSKSVTVNWLDIAFTRQWIKQICYLFYHAKKLGSSWSRLVQGPHTFIKIKAPPVFLLRVTKWLLESSHRVCIPSRKREVWSKERGIPLQAESFPY